jgi:hypothetical protein
MNISQFEKNDWDHLSDVVYGIYHKERTREELEKIFESLPRNLKFIAYEHGMNDTVFRDGTHTYLREEHNKEIEAKDKTNALFAAWVMKAIGDGRIWFSTRPGVWGEPEIDELDVVVEFAGGPERIGNDGSGSFSWRDLQKLAEQQGLLK